MSEDRIGVRTGPVIRGVVTGYGELSAATKALLIIGAVELGTPVQLLQDDIASLVGASLTTTVRTRLLTLLNDCSTDVEQHQPSPTFQTHPEPPKSNDPFDIGQDI